MNKIFQNNYYKKNIHIVLISLLFCIVLFSTIINRIPSGYIVATGDEPFMANIQQSFFRNFYYWGHPVGDGVQRGGEPSTLIHYGFFYVLDILGVSDTQKQNIKYFSFLFLSGLSMYLAIGIFFNRKAKAFNQFIVALFYTFNAFTVMNVVRTGIYLPYYDLYIFLPLIWTLFTKGLFDKDNKYLALSVVLVFLSVGGFQNPAFLLLFFMLLGLTVLYMWIMRLITFRQVILASFVFIIYLLSCAFYSLHLIINILLFSGGVIPGVIQGTDLVRWITDMSIFISYPLRLHVGGPGFPDFFPYAEYFKNIFWSLSFYPTFIVLLSVLFIKKEQNRKWLIFFVFIFLLSIFGTAKVYLSKSISLFIFTLPVVNVLRSYEKFIIVMPLAISFCLAFFLENYVRDLKSKKKILVQIILLILILVFPLPFFLGKFHQDFNMNYVWNDTHRTMVKMPDKYLKVANYLNKDASDYKILNMPYPGQIGTGWVLRPKWKYIGVDFTGNYLNNPLISPVNIYGQYGHAQFMGHNPGLEIDSFLSYLKSRGVRYIIYDHDVQQQLFNDSFDIILNQFNNNLTLVEKVDDIDIYRLNSDQELPIIYGLEKESEFAKLTKITDQAVVYKGKTSVDDNLEVDLNKTQNKDIKIINFKKLSPVKYQVNIGDISQPFWLVFSDTFHPGWKLYKNTNINNFRLSDISYSFKDSFDEKNHYLANGFANAWYIDPKNDKNLSFTLYYLPQNIFYFGLFISAIVLFGSVIYIIIKKKKND